MQQYKKEVLAKILPKKTMEEIERKYYLVQVVMLEPSLKNKAKRERLIKKYLKKVIK